MEYSPGYYEFEDMNTGETSSTSFDIWNSGTGILTYNLSENCSWVTLSTTSGSSTGEHDTITVTVDTTSLSEGAYSCDITIVSNAGTGVFTVTANIDNSADNQLPTVNIVQPERKIYVGGRGIIYFPRPLIIGGPITIMANASDADGSVTQVGFFIDDKFLANVSSEPYNYVWNERAFGLHVIHVIAYDNKGGVSEATIDILVINLGLGSSNKG